MSRSRLPASRVIQRRQCSRHKSRSTSAERGAVSFFAVRCAPKRNHSGIFTPTVHRESVANRGCIFASVPNVVQHLVPALDVPAVRRLLAPGNRDVTIFGEREKRALAGQRKRRCPIWRKPHEALSHKIERKHCGSIAAVEMQIKEREMQCAIKQKTAFRGLVLVQNSKRSFKSLKIAEGRLGSGFQVAQ